MTRVLTSPQGGQASVLLEDGGALEVLSEDLASLGLASTFIFRPGGVTAGNVYATEAELKAAVDAQPGPKVISIDGSLAPCHWASPTWNVNQVTFTAAAAAGSASNVLHFDAGCRLTWTQLRLTGCVRFDLSATTSPVTVQTTPGAVLWLEEDALSFSSSAASGAPFLQVSALTVVFATTSAGFSGTNRPQITVDAGQSCLVYLVGLAVFQGSVVEGAGTLSLYYDSTGGPPAAQPVATTTLHAVSTAVATSYTPAVLANWSGVAPTSVGDALDRIAAHAGPIP